MSELTSLLEETGYMNIRTYIQSGNVILQTSKIDLLLADSIQNLIQKKYGFSVPVTILTADNLNDIVCNNPFIESGINDIRTLHVTLLSKLPSVESTSDISDFKDGANKFIIMDKTIYLYCPNGYGKTKINNTFFEKKLKTTATTRNWKTILTLHKMLQ